MYTHIYIYIYIFIYLFIEDCAAARHWALPATWTRPISKMSRAAITKIRERNQTISSKQAQTRAHKQTDRRRKHTQTIKFILQGSCSTACQPQEVAYKVFKVMAVYTSSRGCSMARQILRRPHARDCLPGLTPRGTRCPSGVFESKKHHLYDCWHSFEVSTSPPRLEAMQQMPGRTLSRAVCTAPDARSVRRSLYGRCAQAAPRLPRRSPWRRLTVKQAVGGAPP